MESVGMRIIWSSKMGDDGPSVGHRLEMARVVRSIEVWFTWSVEQVSQSH